MLKKNEKMASLRGERSQKQVADELGIPVSTYAMIEAGHRFPRKELQLKLSRYFGVTVDELFFTENDHETRTKPA
ncbi:helix-turn-helix transcriptional regulator [Brevibacillus borstelensis]|uniref:helix-turn-helix transcriptional regulator n=1 Tax=Brevibacillus borstelensis TaxID=45462 RepID=UPI000AC57DBC|nr:helix-turn-helix transcriptional regulator [Brevibacillus borstelensis]